MIGNHITHIHARAFSEVPKLTEIVIRNNNIRSIDKRAFEGLGLLKKITLQENLSSVVKGVFHYFLNVTFLSMQVKKTHVPQKEICTLKQLQQLTLEKFQFPSGKFLHCFADLTKLRVLTLNNMKLHSISGATFRPFRVSLEELHLNNCGLRILDVDTFKEFSKLIVLNLRRNAITHLPDTIFTSLTRLTFLDIALNKMKVFSDKLISPLRNLEYLDLGQYNNTMNLVLGKEFLNMTRLHRIYVYGNKISSLNNDTFRYLRNCPIKILDLTSCNLSTISKGAFLPLGNLVFLTLSTNHLTSSALQDAFYGLNGSSLRTLVISKEYLSFYSTALFGNLDENKITTQVFNSSGITVINKGMFHNLGTVSGLDLGNNNIREFEDHAFEDLVMLSTLIIDK